MCSTPQFSPPPPPHGEWAQLRVRFTQFQAHETGLASVSFLAYLLKATSRQTSLCNAVNQRKCYCEHVYNFNLNFKTEINNPVSLQAPSEIASDAEQMHSW